jgi:MFS family permease
VSRPRGLGSDSWRFWCASAASNLGDGIRLGAIPLLALGLTDDARLIAAASAVTMVPWFVVGAIGGAIVDRGDRRRLMLLGS